VTGITLSCKGAVAVSTPSSVLLFDPPPALGLRKELRAPDDSSIRATTFSCKGTDVVSGGSDGFVKWWQVDSGEEVCATQFPQAEGNSDAAVQEVACSKAGFVAAVSGRCGAWLCAGVRSAHCDEQGVRRLSR
jgi:WD40 repeat protein